MTDSVRREICKSGWLKRISTQEKRLSVITPFSKPPKAEKTWVSFCIHNQTEAFLEFYENRRSTFSHKPVHTTCLEQCLHVSPSIRAQGENDHVFVVTLPTQVIKLAASSREQMMEWIDALRSKLRELVILTPKDNLYSKEPGGLRSPLARNPTSPLPPTPIFRFPPTSFDFREEVSSTSNLQMGLSPSPSLNPSIGSGLSIASNCVSGDAAAPLSATLVDQFPSSCVTSYARRQPERCLKRRSSSFRQSLPGSPSPPHIQSGPMTFVRSPPAPQTATASSCSEHVTVINVSSNCYSSSSMFSFGMMGAALESSGTSSDQMPAVSSRRTFISPHNTSDSFSQDLTHDHSFISESEPFHSSHKKVGNSLGAGGSGMVYGGYPYGLQSSHGHQNIRIETHNNSFSCTETTQRDESEGTYEPLFLATNELPPHTPSCLPPTTPSCLPPHPPNTGISRRRSEHRRSGRRDHNRRSASVGPSVAPRQQQYQVGSDGRLMSLREQQVVRLQKEIAHEAGVRLTLRKKDCVNTIAFVNCFNQIFVAGWKQREHPYLHNTFHLGDRLVSIGGHTIASAAEAQNLIRNEPSLMVDFIVRRIPYGKVFALKRESEGQSLGIIRDGNSAEIREIVPGSLSDQQSVPSIAPTVDGLSCTTWVLTEINHRPLNLFFKHSEIADRLNAVGRDISILIQPCDLVRQLKRQLKVIKNYKDYIVM